MFNLKSDLKIYTCDKYIMAKKILAAATLTGYGDEAQYTFGVKASISQKKHQYNNGRIEYIKFVPEGISEKLFREFLELAGVSINSLEDVSTFWRWSQANPNKAWADFQNGVSVSLSLPAPKLDEAFAKIRPDKLMNDLCLSPESTLSQLIGKAKGHYYRRRRRAKDDREAQLLRLWALYGNEIAVSASSAALETVLNGIQLHDFGVSHCENMQSILQFIGEKLKKTESPADLAAAIIELDTMILNFGGKRPERCRPRSPYIAQVYDLIYKTAAA